MVRNQKGITLVEVLAALTLVSIVVTIAWTALSIGMKHTAAETSKTQLQQEANLVVTKLTNEHRKNDTYQLRFVSGVLEIKTCNEEEDLSITCSEFSSLMENNYVYNGTINGVAFISWNPDNEVLPKEEHVEFQLTVKDPVKQSRAVTIKTTLTRILTDR